MSAKSDIVQTTTNPTPSTILAGFAEKRGLTLEAVRQALVCGPCAGIEMAAHTDALYETIVARAEMLGADPFGEIRAFFGQEGLVVYMTLDGYLRMANAHPQMDGVETELPPEEEWIPVGETKVNGASLKCPKWATARVYRRDRRCPISATEYLDECYAPVRMDSHGTVHSNTAWVRSPKRTLTQRAIMAALRMAFGFGTGTALSIDEPKAPVEAETALASAQALVAEAKAEVTEAEAKQVSEPEKEPEKEPEPAPEPAAEPAEAKPAETESEKQKGQTKLIVDALIARLEKGVVSYEKAVDWLQSQAANFTPDELSFALGRLTMLQMQQLKQ